MINFLGETESTLDQKGRFLFPASFRKLLPEDNNSSFVVSRGFDHCLNLFPKQNWDILISKISHINEFQRKDRDFRRLYLNGATPVELDSAGRLLLPKHLADYANLERDIILVSAIDKIELWNRENHKKFLDSYSEDDFIALSDEVMGRVIQMENKKKDE